MTDSKVTHTSIDDACPGEEDIASYLKGCISTSRVSALEGHVARCATCRRLLSALARAASAGSVPEADTFSPTVPLASSAHAAELQRGTRFGRYVVLDWLGAGGMGMVYSAFDPDLNRGVALKVLRNDGTELADRLPIRDLLLREAQAMAQLAHPNVVTVFDVGSVDDRVFIAMELVEGQTLEAWLRAQPRKRSEIIAVFLAAGHGVAAAHAAGLIHRDFKPDNVLVGNDGRVRVTDFGLARAAPPDAATRATGPSAPGQLHTAVAGTLAYMAPEQYLRQSVDARADQFSFAVALYEALSGERPFVSPRIGMGSAAPPTPRGAGIPAALRRVLLRALSLAPDDRYASMTELLAALAPKLRRERRLAIGAVVVGVAAVVFAGAFAIHLQRVAEQRVDRVSRLRGLAPELRTMLRKDQMAPLHDIRPARERVRATMRELERQLQASDDQEDRAVIQFVLGEGHRALGDHERAVVALQAAWTAGERGPQLDVALGDTLGAVYRERLEHIENEVPAAEKAAQTHEIEQRYRDPAMRHLRAALAAGASSPAYLEALIAFHERRFDDASRGASTVFEESQTFYEAGILDARAHHEAGRWQLTVNHREAAKREFAVARQIFERAVDAARSDDDAWLRHGEMVSVQAHDLSDGALPPDLRQQAIDALHRARAINPDRWEAILSEAAIYEFEANLAILSYRDPRPHVERVLAVATEARAGGAPAQRVDTMVCQAYWERATYESTHGVNPRASFAEAITACARASAEKPDAEAHAALGAVNFALANYEAEHGGDPDRLFERSAYEVEEALKVRDESGMHYNLGRSWSSRAHYQANHGHDPNRSVDAALEQFNITLQRSPGRDDAPAAMADALIARARYLQAQHGNAQAPIEEARRALDRSLAMNPGLVAPIKYRVELAELDAEALLEGRADPTSPVDAMRTGANELLRRHSIDRFSHLMLCRAELLAARWALASGGRADAFLTRATIEAARAREADQTDASAWTASAEVELLRGEAMQRDGAASARAIAAGTEFIEQAAKIDPRLGRMLVVRDALARRARSLP